MGLAVKDIVTNLTNVDFNVKVPKSRVGQAVKQIKLVHEEDDGYITVAVKSGRI